MGGAAANGAAAEDEAEGGAVTAAGDWQSMESAPRDGTRIIAWLDGRPIIVWWRSGPSTKRYEKGVKVSYWSSGYFRHPEPEAWQPCPEPPR